MNEAIIKSAILMGNFRGSLDLREYNKQDTGVVCVWLFGVRRRGWLLHNKKITLKCTLLYLINPYSVCITTLNY